MSEMQNIEIDRIPPSHPGEDVRELIEDHGLSQYRLAKALGIQQTRISQIIKGKRSITADTALRLARFFNMTPQYWLNRQMNYDLEMAQIQSGEEIAMAVKPMAEVPAAL